MVLTIMTFLASGSYAPHHPDIGTAIHGSTAHTGVDVSKGIAIGILLLVVCSIALIGVLAWDTRKHRDQDRWE